MECLFNEDYKWNEEANKDMPLSGMLDTYLFDGNTFINNIKPAFFKYKPYRRENCESELYGLNAIFHDHNDLIKGIVEKFFPTKRFTPSEIRNPESEEYFLFMTLYAIQNIVWYQNIEESRSRGYEKTKNEVIKATKVLKEFGYSSSMENTIDFPDHKNDTLTYLESIFERGKKIQRGEKVVTAIKEYFGIKRVTATKEKKVIKSYKKVKEEINRALQIDREKQQKEIKLMKYLSEAEKMGRYSEAEKIKQQLITEGEPMLNRIKRNNSYVSLDKFYRYKLEATKNPFSKFRALCRAYQPKAIR